MFVSYDLKSLFQIYFLGKMNQFRFADLAAVAHIYQHRTARLCAEVDADCLLAFSHVTSSVSEWLVLSSRLLVVS